MCNRSDIIQGKSMGQEFWMNRIDWVGTWLNQFGMFEEQENNVVLNENSVEIKPCINRESKSDELAI